MQASPISNNSLTQWILIAIDGTSSGTDEKGNHGWRKDDGSNSAIFKFHSDFNVPTDCKYYHDGPSQAITGMDSIDVYVNAFGFLTDAFLRCQKKLRDQFSYIADWNEQKKEVLKNIKICMVGHSRGGLIVIEMAKKFPLKNTYFMGLYDAVDRQSYFDGSVISNVEIAYHARRNPGTHSRSLFSNTGINAAAGISYHEQMFFTSHGGIGGDSDFYISEMYTDISGLDYAVQRAADTIVTDTIRIFKHEQQPVFKTESIRANQWIRDGALAAGLPIK